MTPTTAPLWWKAGTPRRTRTFAPLGPLHPAFKASCVLCQDKLGNGTQVQLIAIGPRTGDLDAEHRYTTGRWHNADAVLVHAHCAEQRTDDDLDALAAELLTQGGDHARR